MRNGSCSPPAQRSPTACSSSANGTCGRSWPSTQPITTDVAPPQPPAPTTPARPPRRRPLPEADPAPARPRRSQQRVRGSRIEAQVRTGGRVLEPHRLVVLGYLGEDDIRTPFRGRNKPASQKEANRARARLRAPGERANAQLKSWRILRKLRCCPGAPGSSPRRFTFSRPAESEDKKTQL